MKSGQAISIALFRSDPCNVIAETCVKEAKPNQMKRNTTICLVLLTLISAACCPEVEQETFNFDVESVQSVNFNRSTIDFVPGSNVSIPFFSYAVVIQTTAPDIANARPKSRGGGIFRSPDCDSVVDPMFVLSDEVTSISITATEDFSPDYPAGTELSELFNTIWITKDNPFATPTSFIDDVQMSIEIDFLNNYILGYHDAVDYRQQQIASFYGLELNAQPAQSVQLQFQVELTFQSGRTLNGITPLVHLTL